MLQVEDSNLPMTLFILAMADARFAEFCEEYADYFLE